MNSDIFSQSRKIQSLITELNNTQFIINHSEKAAFTFKSKAALKLIRKGKSAVEPLIQTLSDSTRNIMAQLILCNIYFNKTTFAGPKMITENNAHVYLYFLGEEKGDGMVINEIKTGENYIMYVKPDEIERIKNYWKKLPANTN